MAYPYLTESKMIRLETGQFLGASKRCYHADGIVISEAEYDQRVYEGWHSHENHHVSLIVRGGNREQRRNEEFEASPGKILFYRSGELHRNVHTLHPSKNINIEIQDTFLSQYQIDLSKSVQTPFHYPDAQLCLLKIYNECRMNDAHTITSIHGLVLQMFTVSQPQKKEIRLPRWIHSLREIIHDRWDEMLTLKELSASLQVHPVTISKCFPKYFSCTLGDYMRRVKVAKALPLIQEPHRNLTDIAYRCGFADQSHFTRTFKASTGLLPNEYRKL
jgi:AraC family transcriptional regulator